MTNDELSPKELAARKEVNLNTVYQWTKLPDFPYRRTSPKGRFTISFSDFSHWVRTKGHEMTRKA
jgi:hypothetical protein